MRLLVTGGCGFIGTNFIRFVHEHRPGWEVVNLDKLTYAGRKENLADLDRSRYRFVKGDICDATRVAECMAGADQVVHFAAESHVDRSILDADPFLRTNVLGAGVVFKAALKARVKKFLHVSTDEVYGDVDAPRRSKEEDPFRPGSPYAASKAAADHLAGAFHRTYGFPVVIARSSNNYGPYQYPEKAIPLWISNVLLRRPVPIYGDGGQMRDWIFVEDNVRALVAILEKGRIGKAYNVGGGVSISNKEVAESIHAFYNRKFSWKSVPDRPGHDRRYALDVSKTRALGWEPQVDFMKGLAKTTLWYRDNPKWWGDKRLDAALVEALREDHAGAKA